MLHEKERILAITTVVENMKDDKPKLAKSVKTTPIKVKVKGNKPQSRNGNGKGKGKGNKYRQTGLQ